MAKYWGLEPLGPRASAPMAQVFQNVKLN